MATSSRPEASIPTVVMRKVKRPDTLGCGRHPTYDLGTDLYGTWLFSPKGTIYRAQVASRVVELEVGQGTADAGRDVIHLLSEANGWVAWWCDEFVAVDVCLPPKLIDGEWCVVDLEIDLAAFRDGRVEVTDEEELASACDAGVISHREADCAKATALEIDKQLRERTEPFGRVGWARLADAKDLGLPPIRVLSHVPSAGGR